MNEAAENGVNSAAVPAYAVAHLRDVRLGEGITEYLRQIDDTLRPFGGRFVIHGDRPTVLEGSWTGDLIVIGFPDRERAMAWYGSAEYQRILPLRTENSTGTAFIVDGVTDGHVATDVLG